MAEQPQSFESHAKMVPGYHYVLTTINTDIRRKRIMDYSLSPLRGLQRDDQFALVFSLTESLNQSRRFIESVGAIDDGREFAGFEKFVHGVQILVGFQRHNTDGLPGEHFHQWPQEESL